MGLSRDAWKDTAMTAKKDLKRRVRARQVKTGESYVEARRQVEAQRAAAKSWPVPVVELIDLTSAAETAGFRCRVAMFPALAARVDAATVLLGVRDALLATEDDPVTATMRAAVLHGEQPRFPVRIASTMFAEAQRFMARARAGIGGASAGGRLLAISIAGEMVVCTLHLTPTVAGVTRAPALILTTPEGLVADPLLGLEVLPAP